MSILGDKVIPNDHILKASFRCTSFANLHKTYFETSPWPPDGELCLLCFRDRRSSNNRPTIQRKLIEQNENDLSPFMTPWAKFARDLRFPNLLTTDTVSRVLRCSFGPSRISLHNYDNINALEDLHGQHTAGIKTRNENLSDKKQYVCGHCEWQNDSNKFR
jgi:hypothetical protein